MDERTGRGEKSDPRAPAVAARAVGDEGRLQVSLSGCFRLHTSGAALAELRRLLADLPAGTATVALDLEQADEVDGGILSVLLEQRCRLEARGIAVELVHPGPRQRALLELLGGEVCPPLQEAPRQVAVFEQVGRAAAGLAGELLGALAFVGQGAHALGRALRRPASVNWADAVRIAEQAGADAFAIVFVMNFLVGLVMGFQGSIQLKQFGADIFVANLVGLVQARELGPLMTAIIVAGRSGAAFAAELGTMRVSEEVDALHTLGLDEQRFLVFPRLLALLAVVPLLTLIGDLVGVAGGLVVGITGLDLTTSAYLSQTQKAIGLWDVGSGVLKSFFFAAAIAGIACQRGLATTGGAAGVGRATTSAVVASIFAIVAIDAVFSVVFHVLGL